MIDMGQADPSLYRKPLSQQHKMCWTRALNIAAQKLGYVHYDVVPESLTNILKFLGRQIQRNDAAQLSVMEIVTQKSYSFDKLDSANQECAQIWFPNAGKADGYRYEVDAEGILLCRFKSEQLKGLSPPISNGSDPVRQSTD